MASRFNFIPGTYAGQYEDRGIKIGDEFSQDIWYRDSLSAVVNLSGYTGHMSIRDQANSDTDILVLSTAKFKNGLNFRWRCYSRSKYFIDCYFN